MNPNYFRIKLPKEKALERRNKWNEETPKETIETLYSQAVDNAIDCIFGIWHVADTLGGSI